MNKTTTLGGLNKSDFQETADNKSVELFILSNKNGMEMSITNYGAKIVSLHVPDKKGQMTDVVLGHSSIAEYLLTQEPYFGGICGRVANRIAKGAFTLDGEKYTIAVNNGQNHLHGGIKGFNAVVWDAKQLDHQTIELHYLSVDGEEGFPGNLETKLTYRLSDDNSVEIEYRAVSDKTTLLNLTNHSYFNLSGAGDHSIGDHLLTINADYYLPTDETSIPLGNPEKVENTPMDFRTPHAIGERINEPFQALIYGKGYDHTYVLNKKENQLDLCAKTVSPKTGIVMETYTTEPGVQLYTGNWLTGEFEAKNGKCYPAQSAFCLETQHYPDSINKPSYPTVILRKGDQFFSKTVFKFSVE